MQRISSANISTVRGINASSILSVIRERGAISQAELVSTLSMQPSTVFRIIKALVQEGLVVAAGEAAVGEKGGRRAQLWRLNPQAVLGIGVDVNPGQLKGVVTNLGGEVCFQQFLNTRGQRKPEDIAKMIVHLVNDLKHSTGNMSNTIKGVGLAMPGQVDIKSGGIVTYSRSWDWRNVHLKRMVEDGLDLPVLIENDMMTLARSEQHLGSAVGCRNFLCVVIRSFIHLSMVMDDHVYRGAHGLAGRIAHLPVLPDGPLCYCGNRGCLRTVSSVAGMVDLLRSSGISNTKAFYLALSNGVPEVVDVTEKAGEYLGLALAGLAFTYDPEMVVIGGRMPHINNVFLNSVQRSYQQHYRPRVGTVAPVVRSGLGDGNVSFAVGAAIMTMESLFQAETSAVR